MPLMKLNGQFHAKTIMNTLLKDWRKNAKDCASRYHLSLENKSLKALARHFIQNENFRIMLMEERRQHYHRSNNPLMMVQEIEAILKALPQIARHVDCASHIVKICPQALPLFEHLAHHTKLILAILFNHPERISTYPQLMDSAKLEIALNYNPVIYKYLPEELKKNHRLAKIAISSSVLNQSGNIDRAYGMYPHLSDELKENHDITLTAIKYYPSNFKNLSIAQRKDKEIIKKALHTVFYEQQYCSFYYVQDILPHIDESYFNDFNNLKWLMRAFEKNLESSCLNTESTLIAFTALMKKAGNINHEVARFFNVQEMPSYLEKLIREHNYKIYQDSIPSGLEKDANDFFREHFPKLEKSFNRYLLMKKLTTILDMDKNEDSDSMQLAKI